jgi:hypothetical protein
MGVLGAFDRRLSYPRDRSALSRRRVPLAPCALLCAVVRLGLCEERRLGSGGRRGVVGGRIAVYEMET